MNELLIGLILEKLLLWRKLYIRSGIHTQTHSKSAFPTADLPMVPHLIEQVVRGVGQGPDLSLHRGRADGDVTVCGITVAVLGRAFVALLPLDFFLGQSTAFYFLQKILISFPPTAPLNTAAWE